MFLSYEESVQWAELLRQRQAELPKECRCVVFPTSLAIKRVIEICARTGIEVGVQNSAELEHGAYTGEVSPADCEEIGVRYALIGHSERRQLFHETDHDIHRKLKAVLATKIIPVVCVGETRTEREAGKTDEVVLSQLRIALDGIAWKNNQSVYVAYEPVWAINSGEACSPDEAERVERNIAQEIKNREIPVPVKILYGGSVTAQNIQNYVQSPSCDGVLVGSASVKAQTWFDLVSALRA